MSNETENLAVVQTVKNTNDGGAFSSIEKFEAAQRMAKVLCASSIVPQSYKDNLADCVIALEMANRIGANPLAVMQNLYIVHGRPAWSSQFLISCVNASGKFSPLRYRETGTQGTDSWGCVAWAQDRTGERLESPEVTIGMAKAEGWHGKNGSKWKTMPQLMLRYRAATLFARLFAPELTMGIQCDDEIIDIVAEPARNISPKFDKPASVALPIFTAPPASETKPEDKPTVNHAKAVRGLCKLNGIAESAFIDYLRRHGLDASLSTLEEVALMAPDYLVQANQDWSEVVEDIKRGGK